MSLSAAPEHPGILRRMQAFVFDYLLMLGYLIVVAGAGTFMVLGPFAESWRAWTSTPVRMDLVAFLTAVLPVILYFTLTESSPGQASWGKRRTGLRVTRTNGQRVGRGRAFVRSALKFLPWQVAHTCLFHIPGWPIEPQEPPPWVMVGFALVWTLVAVYLVTLAIGPDRRTPYDWVAGTRVVTD